MTRPVFGIPPVPVLLLVLAISTAGCAGGRPPISGAPVPGDAGAPALLALGDSALAAREPARARALYQRAREAAERAGDRVLLAQATVGTGRILALARRYHDARVEFERAASLDSTVAEPFYYLSLAYLDAGEELHALRTLVAGLRREPGDPRSLAALGPLARARCEAAGLPPDFAELPARTSITRGELAVMLAVVLGLDPDRPGWSSDRPGPAVPREAEGAWGERWLRAALAQGYVEGYPDGSLRLGDPVTRGLLALTVARVERRLASRPGRPGAPGGGPDSLETRSPAETAPGESPPSFPDVGPRHYLRRAAAAAVRLGLPTHSGGAFDPQAAVTGSEALRVLDRLAARAGRVPALPEELREALVVQ